MPKGPRPKVGIIDYKLGNLYSVLQACRKVEIDAALIEEPAEIMSFDGIVVPGVGAFPAAMTYLNRSGISKELKKYAEQGKPILGICLGMQLLASRSDEFENVEGLGLIPGIVRKLPQVKSRLHNRLAKVPLIGWNKVDFTHGLGTNEAIFDGLDSGDYYYFVHSYYFSEVPEKYVISKSNHENFSYASAIRRGNITGLQFHPEKSCEKGITLYRNWAKSIAN